MGRMQRQLTWHQRLCAARVGAFHGAVSFVLTTRIIMLRLVDTSKFAAHTLLSHAPIQDESLSLGRKLVGERVQASGLHADATFLLCAGHHLLWSTRSACPDCRILAPVPVWVQFNGAAVNSRLQTGTARSCLYNQEYA